VPTLTLCHHNNYIKHTKNTRFLVNNTRLTHVFSKITHLKHKDESCVFSVLFFGIEKTVAIGVENKTVVIYLCRENFLCVTVLEIY
jgi:hypothetical protein